MGIISQSLCREAFKKPIDKIKFKWNALLVDINRAGFTIDKLGYVSKDDVVVAKLSLQLETNEELSCCSYNTTKYNVVTKCEKLKKFDYNAAYVTEVSYNIDKFLDIISSKD